MILVSACLAGLPCRYNGSAKTDRECSKMVAGGEAIVFCPEVASGLPTPRTPCEIVGGDGGDVLDGRAKVIDVNGRDCTEFFVLGAKKALEFVKINNINAAYLKSLSPSCGCGTIYDGSFSGVKIEGDGVLAALLKRNGIEVVSR